MNCLGYYTFSFGKLKIGVRVNSSTVEAFTGMNSTHRHDDRGLLSPRCFRIAMHGHYEWQDKATKNLDDESVHCRDTNTRTATHDQWRATDYRLLGRFLLAGGDAMRGPYLVQFVFSVLPDPCRDDESVCAVNVILVHGPERVELFGFLRFEKSACCGLTVAGLLCEAVVPENKFNESRGKQQHEETGDD